MTKFIYLIISLIAISSFAESSNNALKNGDFEKGASRWKGGGKAKYEIIEGEKFRFLRLKLRDNNGYYTNRLIQDISRFLKKNKTVTTLKISFRYRLSEDYSSNNSNVFYIGLKRNSWSYTSTSSGTVKTTVDQWHEFSTTLTVPSNNRKDYKYFFLRAWEGSGHIDFDDFVISAN